MTINEYMGFDVNLSDWNEVMLVVEKLEQDIDGLSIEIHKEHSDWGVPGSGHASIFSIGNRLENTVELIHFIISTKDA